MPPRLSSVDVKLQLPFLELRGVWTANEKQREAAWQLYVELVTRVALVPLDPDSGLLGEALASLHTLFDVTRGILKVHGPALAQPANRGELSFGVIAVTVLNRAVRPFLTHWHAVYSDWESQRPTGVSPLAHEQAWERAPEMRRELAELRHVLVQYAGILELAMELSESLLEGDETELG